MLMRLKMMAVNVCLSLALLVLLVQAALVSAYYPTQRPSTGGGLHGRRCDPPVGFRPRGCGFHEILNTVAEPICEYLWGPNVCLITDTVSSNFFEYRYSQGCDWVYSHYYYTWVRQCNSVCQPTNVCLEEEVLVYNRSYERCCPGFAARRRSVTHNPYNGYHYNYYIPIRTEPEGCPIAVGDSLLECLERHGLDEFIEYVIRSVYDFNQTTSSHVTLFVPTNDAVRRGVDEFFIPEPTSLLFNMSQLVGNHLVLDNVTMASLRVHSDKIYVNANGRNLHKVAVTYTDLSSVSYSTNPYYSNPGGGASVTITHPFINGAEVVLADACKTENATLHIINKPLAPSESTIADYLESQDRFESFTDALRRAGILQFLGNPNVSRTVFAVPDTVFDAVFPEGLLECLLNYMRRPINDILLYHIGQGAHYDTSLSRTDFFYTLLGQYVQVEVDSENGDILLGRCGVPIIQSNLIMASNGVIHNINGVLFPNSFSFGMCQSFVPFPSPTECPEEPSPSPTVSVFPSVMVTNGPIPTSTPDAGTQNIIFGD